MKQKFIDTLLATKRPNMEQLIEKIDKLGFFKAPASSRFHLSRAGGLLEHSTMVYETALRLRETFIQLSPELEHRLPLDSIAIACLLHDICKAEIYIPTVRNVKNKETNQWESVDSFEVDLTYFPMGHGEKSVIRILGYGVQLTKDEMLAIRWHMGRWDVSDSREAIGSLGDAQNTCPLLILLQCADSISSHLLEK